MVYKIATVVPFFSKGSVRDPDAEPTTTIPMIKTDSNFVTHFDITRYQVFRHFPRVVLTILADFNAKPGQTVQAIANDFLRSWAG